MGLSACCLKLESGDNKIWTCGYPYTEEQIANLTVGNVTWSWSSLFAAANITGVTGDVDVMCDNAFLMKVSFVFVALASLFLW